MAMKWSDVAANPAFQALSFDEQEEARNQYFNEVVAPQVSEEERDSVRGAFLSDTQLRPEPVSARRELPEGMTPSTAGGGRGSVNPPMASPKDDRGIIQRVADYLKPEFKSVMEDYVPTAAEKQADVDRRLSYGAGPISQQTAAMANEVRSSRGQMTSRNTTVNKVVQAMDARGDKSFADMVDSVSTPAIIQATRDAKADEFRSAGEWATDMLSSLSQGAVSLVQLPINIVSPSSDIAATLRDTQKQLQAQESDVLKAQREQLRERVQNEDGFLDKYAATVLQLVTSPALGLSEAVKQVPNFLGIVGAARLVGTASAGAVGLAGRASPTVALGEAISGGAIQAGARAAGTTAGGIGASMVMTGGDAAGGVYEKLTDPKRTPLSVWEQNPDYQKMVANGKPSQDAIEEISTTKARIAALVTAPLGLLGFMGAEAAVASRGLGKATAEALTFAGAGKMLAKDLIGEQLQEGGTQFGGNVVSRTVNPKQSLTEGVPEAMGTALVASAPFSMVGAASQYQEARAAQAPDLAAQQRAVDLFDPNTYDASLVTPAQTTRSVADVGPSAPINFTPSDSPTAQAGLAPIVVPTAPETTDVSSLGPLGGQPDLRGPAGSDQLGGGLGLAGRGADVAEQLGGGNAGLPAANAGADVLADSAAGQPTPGVALPRVTARATDQDLLARTEAAIAAPEYNNDVVLPSEQWFGRKGDGYATQADAAQAVGGRQRMFPTLDWKVEEMPSGKYRLAGYANTQENVNANQAPQAQQAAQEGSQEPAAAAVAAPITTPSGKPFSTQQTAAVFAQQNGITGYSTVKMDGGWAIKPTETSDGVGLQSTGQGVAAEATASVGVAGQTAPGVRNTDQRTVGFNQSGQPAGAPALGGVAADGTAPALRLALPAPAPVQQRAFTALKTSNRGDVVAATGPLREDQQAASALSRMMGKTATFFNVQTPGKVAAPNAFVTNGDTKNIFMDANSDDAPTALVFHEGYHLLPPEKRKVIAEQLAPLFRQDRRAEFGQEFGYDDAQIDEEIPAFIAQSVSRKPEFMGQLKEKLKNKEFASAIGLMINNMKNILTRANQTYGQGFSDKYISDVKKAVDILSTAYAEHMDSQGEGVQAAGTGMELTASNRVAGDTSADQAAFDFDRVWRDLTSRNAFSDYDQKAEIEATLHSSVGVSLNAVPSDFVLTHEVDGNVASLSVREQKTDNDDLVLSSSLEVFGDYQKGTGIATKMYLAALNVAKKRKIGWMSEGVRSDDSFAIYERLKAAGVPFESLGSASYISAATLKTIDLSRVAQRLQQKGKPEITASNKQPASSNPQREQVLRHTVEVAKREILADIANGAVPESVKSFQELHDYVDANMYVSDADRDDRRIGPLGKSLGWKVDDYVELTNDAMDQIDAWLKSGRSDDSIAGSGGQRDADANIMPPEQINANGITFSLKRIEEINDAPEITMQDLVGETVFPILADLTAAGYVYMGKELRGGPYYTLLPSNSKAGVIWANDGKGVASIKNKKASRGVIGLIVAMKQSSHATNNTVANIVFRAVEDEIQKGSVAQDDIPKLDEIVRGLSERKAKNKKTDEMEAIYPQFAEFPGFSDRAASEDFLRTMSFEGRGLFFEEMTKPTVEDLGLGVIRKVINDTIEPDLRGLNMGDVVMAIRFDPNADTIELGEKSDTPEHDSYRYGVKGEVIGKFNRPISFENVFVDLMDERRAAGKDKRDGNYRSLTLRKPEQLITQAIADRITQTPYQLIGSPAEAQAVTAAANLGWNKIDRPAGAGVKEFLRTSRIYGQGDKTPSFVEAKALIKGGKLRIFRLAETENWFALEDRDGDRVMTSVMVAQPGVRQETLFGNMIEVARANAATHIEIGGVVAPLSKVNAPRRVTPILRELSAMTDADLVNLGIDPADIRRLGTKLESDDAVQVSPTAVMQFSNKVTPADKIRWRKITDLKTDIGNLDTLPNHIVPFATFMKDMSTKAANGGLTSRDVIKAYTIARSSMNRTAVSTEKIRAAGLVLPKEFTDPKIRPEGAFGYWLLSPTGQQYLNAAEVAIVDADSIANAVKVMAPFGTQNTLGGDLERAANGSLHTRLPGMTAAIAKAAQGKNAVKDWQDATDNMYGVREAKKGFLGSLLGFGQLPTFDARQININVKADSKEDTLKALSSKQARNVVAKLSRRMDALGLAMDPEFSPFYQHLVHHAVWDAVGGTETTHADVIDSMIRASNRQSPATGVLEDRIGVSQLSYQGYVKAEVPRVQAARKMTGILAKLDAGEITLQEFELQVRVLSERLTEVSATKEANKIVSERARGADIVREKLLAARRRGEVDSDTTEFALWALQQNPAMAEGLGVSVREQPENQRGAAGDYNPAAAIMRVFKGSSNTGTAVHEILHHTERMMPEAVQTGIRKEWSKAYAKALAKADPNQRVALEKMLEAMAGSQVAQNSVREAFSDGTLKYDAHYQLVNPSEFWAVNATDILQRRYEADSWIGQAKQWLSEMVQKAKGLVGMRSNAPVLRGLEAVLNTDGGRQSKKMLSDGKVFEDIAAPDTAAFRKWFGDSKVVDAAGKPLVVYHGTQRAADGIVNFGKGTGYAGQESAGVSWFTSDTGTASGYANWIGGAGNPTVYPVYLNIQSPASLSDFYKIVDALNDKHQADWQAKYRGKSEQEKNASLEVFAQGTFQSDPEQSLYDKRLVDALTDAGFDGVIWSEGEYNGEANEGPLTYVAFSPTQIKSAIGNNGDFDGANSDITASNRRQKLSTIGQNFTLPATNKRDSVRIKLQDDALRMKRVIEAVKAKGGTVGEAQNFYDANTLMPGRVQATMDNFRDNVMRPLIDKAVGFGIDLDELALYAYAKHAKERNAYIASINKRFPDGGSGMTNDHADTILQLAQLSGDDVKFEELHRELMAITATTRQIMLAEGLITQDEFNALDGAYDNYIPLRGLENVDENSGAMRPGIGRGINVRGGETIKALGRKSQAGDLIENVIRDYQRVILRVEKNDVGKVLLDFVLSNPDPDLWGVDVERSKPALNKATGLVQYTKAIEKGEDTIGVKVGGTQIYIKLADADMARAIRQAWKDETSGLERATLAMTGWWNNWMRNVLTRYNPAFAAINIPRDALWSGTAAALDELGPKGLGKYLANYGKALMASTRQEAGVSGTANRIIGNPQMDQVFQEFRNAGSTTGGFYMRSLDDINKDLRNDMLMAGAKSKTTFEAIKSLPPYKLATLTLKLLEFMGSASENATRFALYQAAKEVGKTPAQAALLAKNGTTNFNRKGEWGGALNNLYLFFNAGVQGTAQLAKVLKNPAVVASMAGVAGVGMMLALYGASAGGEDDDGEAYWDKIPGYVKERNMVIMLPPGDALAGGIDRVGKRGRYITIPVQYGFNIFPNAGYMMADVYRNAKDPKRGVTPTKAALHMTSTVFGSINPLGGSIDFGDGVQVLLAAMPTLADLPIQLINERGTFGTPSSPQKSMFDKRPDSERMFTSQQDSLSAKLAKILNELGGGNEAKAGKIMGVETSVAPGTIQTLIGATTGGLGTFVEQVGTAVVAMTGDTHDLKANKIPFLNKFYGEVDEGANITKAGERMREVKQLSDEVKAQQKLGLDPGLKDEEERLMALSKMQEIYQKQSTMIRKREIEIIKDPKMTDPEKKLERKQLQVDRDRLSTDMNREYLKVVPK